MLSAWTLGRSASTMRFTPGIGTILRILEREDADGGKRFEVVVGYSRKEE